MIERFPPEELSGCSFSNSILITHHCPLSALIPAFDYQMVPPTVLIHVLALCVYFIGAMAYRALQPLTGHKFVTVIFLSVCPDVIVVRTRYYEPVITAVIC